MLRTLIINPNPKKKLPEHGPNPMKPNKSNVSQLLIYPIPVNNELSQ